MGRVPCCLHLLPVQLVTEILLLVGEGLHQAVSEEGKDSGHDACGQAGRAHGGAQS